MKDSEAGERTFLQSTLGCNSFIYVKVTNVSLQHATTLLQKPNQRIKLGLVCGRLLANRHVVWMPVSELTVCLIIDEAERGKNVGDEPIPECSLIRESLRGASYGKKYVYQ